MTQPGVGGQPSRIVERLPVIETDPRTGQRVRSERTEALVDVLVRSVRAGAPIGDACAAVYPPVSRATYHAWQKRGREERGRLDQLAEEGIDAQPSVRELPYLEFYDRCKQAEHEAKVEALVAIRRAIVGYDNVETTVVEVESPVTLTDADGVQHVEMVTKRTTTTKRARAFSWQAAMTWLERRYGQEYARRFLDALNRDEGDEPVEDKANRALVLLDNYRTVQRHREVDATSDAPPHSNGDGVIDVG